MRFLAPRVSDAFPLRGFGDAAARESFVADFFRAYVPDPRRLLSRPGRTVKVPATPMGFT